jgi:hypothetical protein
MNNKNAFSWMRSPELIQHICEELETDVIVVGAGQAGTCAARGASETAAVDVIVIEQQSQDRQFILGNGEIGHINSKWLEKQGFPRIDIDEFVNDWQIRTNNRSNYKLIRTFAEKCGDCFDWFIEPLTDEQKASIYPLLKIPSEHLPKTLNYIHAYPGTAKMPVLVQNEALKINQEVARKNGAKFMFGTRACQLLVENEKVKGIIVKQNNRYIKILARKGVILAAGDYSKNEQMCRDLLTEAADLIEQGTDWVGHGWDGSGIQMGVWAGGRIEPRSHAAMGGNYSLPGFEVIGSTAVLRVNKYGKRYSNEGFGTHILGALAGAKQPNGMLYGIFDENILEQIKYQAPCHAIFDYCNGERVAQLKDYMERAIKAGKEGIPINKNGNPYRRLYSAETIEKLAEYVFSDRDSRDEFAKTVDRYNQMCRDRKDIDFGKEPVLLHEIKKPPYYAVGQLKNSHNPIGQSFKLLVTVSGLLINEDQQVLNEEYEPIEGLYATGNTSGCRFGFQYTTSVPGQSISIAHTLGREVGKHVAELERKLK